MNDAEKWLKRIIGERVEPREESRALPSYYYGNPEEVYARNQGMRKAQEKKVKKGGGR